MVAFSSAPAGPVPAAFVLGLDVPAGAYLARLLQARGQRVSGAAHSGPSLLAALGSEDEIREVGHAEAAAAVATSETLYVVSPAGDGSTSLIDAALQAVSATTRLVHVADKDLLVAQRPVFERARHFSALRREAGRFAANAILHPHDSRLGHPDALPARLSLAAFRASNGEVNGRLRLAQTAPEDWGWTPEYVDAVARLAALPKATDIEIGSGEAMTAHDMAGHVSRWFKLDPEVWLQAEMEGAASEPARPVDTERLKTLLGWRAFTTGGDLMAALCEAAGQRLAGFNL